ncbi:GAF and ANTAR domain-containing protein [Streptomyces sp. DT24]|uniref:GAF and ANTAR domain-containing protein n=1 Tax=unclassified Streptomyces TaxID=2593676 RepID=UPI0023B9CF54|nr:GAF and ANTAR domain-containing protein [Streptomyces sp. AM 4-1-1]WEH35139.1 GAF and ANTAR domain-containing protein [Streptomyces sp. AM 4-1-1]
MTDEATTAPLDVTALLLETDSLNGFLQALAEAALARAPAAGGCGVTVEGQGRPLTVASAGASALALDEAQYGRDDGPCLQSLRNGEEIHVPEMLDEKRWEDYPAFAAVNGARSSLSLPIAPHTHTSGALNLYSPVPNAFDGTDLVVLRSLAAQATGAIALAQRMATAQEFTADLQAALRSRTVIDQAIGVIMGQRRCSSDEAFGLLRTASQHRNIKLRDLCTELVTNLSGRPPSGEGLRPRA